MSETKSILDAIERFNSAAEKFERAASDLEFFVGQVRRHDIVISNIQQDLKELRKTSSVVSNHTEEKPDHLSLPPFQIVTREPGDAEPNKPVESITKKQAFASKSKMIADFIGLIIAATIIALANNCSIPGKFFHQASPSGVSAPAPRPASSH